MGYIGRCKVITIAMNALIVGPYEVSMELPPDKVEDFREELDIGEEMDAGEKIPLADGKTRFVFMVYDTAKCYMIRLFLLKYISRSYELNYN